MLYSTYYNVCSICVMLHIILVHGHKPYNLVYRMLYVVCAMEYVVYTRSYIEYTI